MDQKDVVRLYNVYNTLYQINNERGKGCINFCSDNQQWDPGVPAQRSAANKETLIFNNIKKYLDKIKSQNSQIAFQVNVNDTDDTQNQAEYRAFKLLVKHWFTSKNMMEKFIAAFDKCIDYGYAVGELNYGYFDKKSLNKEPILTIYDDPSEAFFDVRSQLKSRIDGNFCGRRRVLNKKDLLRAYPEMLDSSALQDKGNVVFDFWCRDKEKCYFVKLKTGVWYRQDLLTDDDYQNNVMRNMLGMIQRRKGTKDCIYYYRYVNTKAIIDGRAWPTEDLPLIYHAGLTEWSDKGPRSYPYAWYMKDAQKFLNLTKSQLATNLKNSTSTKFFLGPQHITNDHKADEIRNLNAYEGALAFGDDPSTIRIIPPTELPMTQINLAAQASQDLEAIAGSMSDMQMSDSVVTSGVALKEITNNIQMINAGLVAEQVRFIDSLCVLYVQMLPNICTEERDFFVKNENDKIEKVGVNIKTPSGLLLNDINNIRNKFFYEVEAGATTAMQQENTVGVLMQVYQINPQLLNDTADIFFKNTDTPYAQELARRVRARIDPDLIKVGNGEITEEQYQEIQQKKTAQQPPMPPEPPSAMMAAQAEAQKAQAATQNAKTNQMKAEAQIQQAQTKLHLDTAKTQSDMAMQDAKQELDKARLQLDATQAMINSQTAEANSDNGNDSSTAE